MGGPPVALRGSVSVLQLSEDHRMRTRDPLTCREDLSASIMHQLQ